MATTLPKKKRKSGKEIKDSAKLNDEVSTVYDEVYGNKLRNKILQSMQ